MQAEKNKIRHHAYLGRSKRLCRNENCGKSIQDCQLCHYREQYTEVLQGKARHQKRWGRQFYHIMLPVHAHDIYAIPGHSEGKVCAAIIDARRLQ